MQRKAALQGKGPALWERVSWVRRAMQLLPSSKQQRLLAEMRRNWSCSTSAT